MVSAFFFYFFSAILLVSAILVITARNPVHSVLFLILAFFTSAGIFILLNAEFIAMIMVIVYVGAVTVLFLFVVMMLDISFADLRVGALKFIPLGLIVGAVFLSELYLVYKAGIAGEDSLLKEVKEESTALASNEAFFGGEITNAEAVGRELYTTFLLPFQIAGLVLLVAMVGAIVLTLRLRPDSRRQNIADQVARSPQEAMEVKKVPSGTGV